MSKIDISQNYCAIKNVFRVIRAENKNRHRKSFVNSRPSDVFVYIVSGRCEYEFEDGESFVVKTGDIMYLSKEEKYSIYVTSESYKFIFCDFEFLEARERKSAVFTPKNDAAVESIFLKLLNTYNAQSKTCFTDCLSLIYSIYSVVIATQTDSYLTKDIKNKIIDAKSYIDTHYNDTSLSISQLSKQHNMSDVYFRKLFKREFGISPAKYIVSARLKKAKHLLLYYPFLSVEECALQSGFNSVQYFSRVFFSEFGIAPSKYRKK